MDTYKKRLKKFLLGLGISAATIGIILANLPSESVVTPPSRPPAEEIRERPDLANWNSNSVQNADGSITTDFRIKWVNYLAEDETWHPINPNFVETPDGWVVTEAPFIALAPKTAAGTAYFISNNRWDVFRNAKIDAPFIAQKIEAQGVVDVPCAPEEGDLGWGKVRYVACVGAYPDHNADLIWWVSQRRAPSFDKLIRFNSPLQEDAEFDFAFSYEVEGQNAQELRIDARRNSSGKEFKWNEKDPLKIKRGLSVRYDGDDSNRGVGIKDFQIWDAGRENVEPVFSRVSPASNGFILSKLIPSSYFAHAGIEYPVYTDTTSTFYPDPSVEVTSVDGSSTHGTGVAWATAHDATDGTTAQDTGTTDSTAYVENGGAGDYYIRRGFYLFDTSAIPDGDTISAATFSLAANASGTADTNATSLDIVSSTPASNTAITTADYDQVGTTVFATKAISAWTDTAGTYNDFALSAAGITNISKTGVSKFGYRNSKDTANSAPASTGADRVTCRMADFADTTSDPKLVVTHAAGRKSIIIIN